MYGGTETDYDLQIFNAEFYGQLMERINRAVREKGSNRQHEVMFLEGNTRPHIKQFDQ